MNTCKTCKWWSSKPEESRYDADENKTYYMVKLWRECNNPKLTGRTPERLNDAKGYFRSYGTAVVKDGSLNPPGMETESNHTIPLDQAEPDASDTHGIGFYTGPNFGCIHHESK